MEIVTLMVARLVPKSTDAEIFDVTTAGPQRLIMIVGNDLSVRDVMRRALEAQGYGILETSYSEIALEPLCRQSTLIIVDLDSPDIRSDDLLRMLRRCNVCTPIVALSKRADETCVVQALDLGADAYLTKPFGMKELIGRMRNMLRRRFTVVHGKSFLLRSDNLSVDLSHPPVRVGDRQVDRMAVRLLRNSTGAGTFNVAATAPRPWIMIVENDSSIRNMLRVALKIRGYEVLEASSAGIGLELLSDRPALIIVDLDLPDIQSDGLLRRLRGRDDRIPIVALSSRTNESSIVQALNLGADAYLTKPFGMKELLVRIRNLLRQTPAVVHGERPLLRSGALSVDLSRRRVKVGEKQVKLTRTEYELLLIFLHNAGKVLTHRFLLGELWNHTKNVDQLRVYVRHVRQKVEADPGHPRLLLTEAGIGYRMLAPPSRELVL